MRNLFYIIISILMPLGIYAQQEDTNTKLENLAKTKKSLNETIKADVSGLNLYEFLTTVAQEHQLNVSVDNDLNQPITNTFFDVSVKDVFVFLAQKYDLEVQITNNIIVFSKKKEIKSVPKKIIKVIDVGYNSQNDFLSIKLENDSIPNVVQAIVDKTGKNIVLAPDIKNQKISAYIINRPFDQVIEMMAKSNNLMATKDENGFYFIEKNTQTSTPTTNDKSNPKGKMPKAIPDGVGSFEVQVSKNGLINVKANAADIAELISEAADKLHINYFYYNKPENEKTSLQADQLTFEQLLENSFKGKKYTFKKQGDLYIIGEQITEGLRATEIIQLENRSIELVLASLPKVFSEKLEIKEFVELNGLIVSGPKNTVEELKIYIKQIDKVVPMVQIEVMIVQYNKSYDIQTGIKSGLDKSTTNPKTSGSLFPTTDIALNSTSVNSLISAFNGLGIFKLGKVTSAFYMNLQALENNAIIKIESTPKIATISGHEAKLAIGETSYYFEQSNQLINSGLNNNVLQSGTWKSTEANLSVSIKPYVSTDENVTLNITVEKSSFLARVGATAPPGKATQKFESLVRVKNSEMVLLGGLDELQKENSGTGVPLISRIPIINWFFSSRKKSKKNSKLHIFLKPTVVY